MTAKILTGYTGTRHIGPLDDAAVYRSIIGQDCYIVNEGNLCAGTMPSINEFNVASGQLSIQGVQARVTAETLSVDTCATGYKRIDLVVASWTHDAGTLIDDVTLKVLKGSEVQSGNTPIVPTYNSGDIDSGATAVDFPLYQINLSGGTVTFEQLADVLPVSIDELSEGLLNLDTSAPSGTTDGDLYAAIVALGWDSDVIES